MPYRTLENVIDGVVITFTDASATQRMEVALRRQASELKQMIESLPHLTWGSTPNGACDYFSPTWMVYTGVTLAELQGYGWLQAVHPDDRESVREKWRSAIESGAALNLELRVRGKDGSYRWFQLRSEPIRDSDGQVVKWYGTGSDIHDLKVAVERRKQAVDRLISILKDVSEPFLVLSDGETVNYANVAAQRMLGNEHIVGKSLLQVLPESASARFRDTFRKVARDGGESSFDAHFKEPGGNGRFKVRVFPNSEGVAVFFQPHNEDGEAPSARR